MTFLMHNPAAIRADSDPRFSAAGAAPGDCALFTLPHVVINGVSIVTDERAIVNIPFRAKLLSGYSGKYAIRIGNAVTGIMTIKRTTDHEEINREYPDYVHIENGIHACMPSETVASSDYTVLAIRPDNNWLEPGQHFHVFKIAMGGYRRYTDNGNQLPPYHATGILFGIQRPH